MVSRRRHHRAHQNPNVLRTAWRGPDRIRSEFSRLTLPVSDDRNWTGSCWRRCQSTKDRRTRTIWRDVTQAKPAISVAEITVAVSKLWRCCSKRRTPGGNGPGGNLLSPPAPENDRLSSLFRDWPLACIGRIGSPCAVPENGTVLMKTDEGRDENGEHNSGERSCVRHGRRNGHRRWTNRAPGADVLFLRLQVQREVRCESGALPGQVRGTTEERPRLLRLSPGSPLSKRPQPRRIRFHFLPARTVSAPSPE